MNGQNEALRRNRVRCDTIIGIIGTLAKGDREKQLKKLGDMRAELAAEIRKTPGSRHLRTFIIDGKWFLTGTGKVDEIVSPPPEVLPEGRYVMHFEEFLKFAGIKAFSSRPIT